MEKRQTDYLIRAYEDRDFRAVLELYTSAFGAAAARLFEKRRQWEFVDNPSRQQGQACQWVALAADIIIGHLGGRPALFNVDGRVVQSVWPVDLAVAQAYRGRGIATKLFEQLESGSFKMTVMLGGAVATLRIVRNHGWHEVGADIAGAMCLSRRGVLRFLRSSQVYHPSASWLKLVVGLAASVSRKHPALRSDANTSVREIEAFDSRFDRLWDLIAGEFSAIGARDAHSLQWRFARNPNYRFRVFAVEEGNTVAGYAVTLTRHEGGVPVGYIADFVTAPGHKDACEALAQGAIACLSDSGAQVIFSIGLSVRERAALRNNGFTFNPLIQHHLQPHFCFSMKDPAQAFLSPGQWFLSGFDYDVLM